jgi:hypothetical protein
VHLQAEGELRLERRHLYGPARQNVRNAAFEIRELASDEAACAAASTRPGAA